MDTVRDECGRAFGGRAGDTSGEVEMGETCLSSFLPRSESSTLSFSPHSTASGSELDNIASTSSSLSISISSSFIQLRCFNKF